MKPQNKKIWQVINTETKRPQNKPLALVPVLNDRLIGRSMFDLREEIEQRIWSNVADKVAEKLEYEYETNR